MATALHIVTSLSFISAQGAVFLKNSASHEKISAPYEKISAPHEQLPPKKWQKGNKTVGCYVIKICDVSTP